MRLIILFLSALILSSSTVGAVGAEKKSVDKTLWEHWYTITVSPDLRYGYYNEKVSLKSGKLHFETHMWKKDDGAVIEEQLGVFSEDNPELTPLFFNFHSTQRATETMIDGTVNAGMLNIKAKRSGTDLPIVRRSIPKKTIFSVFFPVLVGRKISQKAAGIQSFSTILEDNLEKGFAPVSGTLKIEKPDDVAGRLKATKVAVEYQGMKSNWYVDSTGAAIRIDMLSQKTLVERVSKTQAEAFLK